MDIIKKYPCISKLSEKKYKVQQCVGENKSEDDTISIVHNLKASNKLGITVGAWICPPFLVDVLDSHHLHR